MSDATKMSVPPIIRLSHPLAFGAFLKHIGAPVERHLRSQGLPVYCDNPNEFVPLQEAWSFFDATAQSEDPMLGWHVGQFVGDQKLNHKLLQQLENAPTLYQALKRLVRMVSAEASHLQLGILERRDDILFCTQYSKLKDWPGYTSSQAYQLEVYLDLVRHFVGRDWVPNEIGIEHPTVPGVAEEHFDGCRILTHQQVGYIAIPRACLYMASPTVGPEEKGEKPLFLSRNLDYVGTLKTLLKPRLRDSYPSARKAASLMDTSVRSLARRLSERGSSYRKVVDEVRLEAAWDLLRNTDQRISDIAANIGFEDPAHFARMFRRLAGLTPRQYRQDSQA